MRFDDRGAWFEPYRALARGLPDGQPAVEALDALCGASDGLAPRLVLASDALTAPPGPAAGTAVRFVPGQALPAGDAYETFIARTGAVPTRDNLHDLFNGLVWLRHPTIKRRLIELHAAEIAARGVGPTRGPLRDALTLFDENGAIWTDPQPRLLRALRERDWRSLFVAQRAAWAGQRFEIFGHALLEQLATAPRKALTAHVVVVDPLALPPAEWAEKPFLPLPVLGIPGWWPANGDPDFYMDIRVFRPASPLKSTARP